MVENVRRQVRPVPLDLALNLLKCRPEPLLFHQMKQPGHSVGFDVRVGIIVGPREMM